MTLMRLRSRRATAVGGRTIAGVRAPPLNGIGQSCALTANVLATPKSLFDCITAGEKPIASSLDGERRSRLSGMTLARQKTEGCDDAIGLVLSLALTPSASPWLRRRTCFLSNHPDRNRFGFGSWLPPLSVTRCLTSFITVY